MHYALRLGEKGRLMAPPNPWVGCVIVKDEAIIGEGYHVSFGADHAELVALRQAGKLAQGATAYITLEPCAHQGKTPPCTTALIEAGISRVVIPFLDPDPNVFGKGKEALEKAGIEVILDIASLEARQSLLPYLHHRETGLPLVVLKIATSLDGKAAAFDGSSQWITTDEARQNSHYLRAASGAIIVGSGTAIKDNPKLTVRGIEQPHKQPLRVLIDRKGKVSKKSDLFDESLGPTFVYRKSNLRELLIELGRRPILQVLVEGGPALQSHFLNQNLANLFHVYVGGCLLGEKGVSAFPNQSMQTIQESKRWKLQQLYRFGNDVRLDFLIS